MSTFTLHTLGCGSAKPSLRHNPSSTVLNIREKLFMIDCGEGTQLALQRHRLKFSRLNNIFLTHLHGDHCLGLPGLISTLALTNKGGTVTIHTFKPGIKMFKKIFDYFCHERPYDIEFNEIEPTEATIYEDNSITVRTIPLSHRIDDVGFIFEEKPKQRHIIREMIDFYKVPVAQLKSIKDGNPYVMDNGTIIDNNLLTRPATPSIKYAHISDTIYLPEIAPKIGNVNLLFHETTYLNEHESDAIKRGHSTAAQAAMMARDCGAKQLLTGHYSSRYKDESLFLKEAQDIFPNTILNHEGLRIPLD